MEAEYITKSPGETIDLASRFAATLTVGDNILLYGDLGAGKTQFAKGVAKGLGISETIKSPTFAYVNEYEIDLGSRISDLGSSLYHYDLYRLDVGADLTSLGFEETIQDESAINVVEWADRLTKKPHGYIKVVIEPYLDDRRSIKIAYHRSTQLSQDSIDDYYEDWQTPLHVRDHCKQVASVAMQMAEAFAQQGIMINDHHLYVSCMLHDMCRVCDFRSLDRNSFQETVTEDKWNRWEKLRERFKGIHHADIAFEQMQERGYSDTAEAIRLHKSTAVVKEPDSFISLEQKIVYYADKRVKHTEIVDLKERFRDGRERYGDYNTDEERKLYEQVEQKTIDLEKELFEKIDLNAEDIH